LGGFGLALIASGILFTLLAAPLGGIFGLITTRSIVQRLRKLTTAATLFADGNYEQRVPLTRKDEIGQLEQQFNRMAQQLVGSIAKSQELAEQNARLAERSRISRELHDAISQDLFSLRMLASGLQMALPQDSPLQPQIAALNTTTTSMLREMRALLLELRPLSLERLGLIEGIAELATSYSTRLGITVNTEIAPAISTEQREQLSTQAQHTLVRISQEALANAVRHAHASSITISLTVNAGGVELTVTDDGSGFHLHEEEARHGLGLRLIQERVQELSGTFTLKTAPGQGTTLYVCLPQEYAYDTGTHC
ncbi:MAG TPA: ATP-binding protein, partial [Ktedonobacteraceae bacterium]|nr:ATP-binding protein [Ktedonobacteraceae bacterium]